MTDSPSSPIVPIPAPPARWLCHVLAVVMACAMLLFRLWIGSWLGDHQMMMLFLIPVTFAAYLGGLGPGLTATFIGAFASGYWILPQNQSTHARFYHLANWSLLILTGVIVSLLCEALHKNRAAAYEALQRIREADAELLKALKDTYDLRNAIDQHAIVAVTDSKGRITYANDKFCEISGFSHDELIGNNHRILSSGCHPKEFFQGMWKTIAAGQTWHGEIRNKAKDGSHYWVKTTIAPMIGAKNVVRQYIAIRTDITQIKLAEAKLRAQEAELRTLFEHINEGIAVFGLDRRIRYVNRAGLQILGFGSMEEAQLTPEEMASVLEFNRMDGSYIEVPERPGHRILRGEQLHRELIRVKRYDSGWTCVLEFGGGLARDTANQPILGVMTFKDVTSQIKAEERLRASEAQMRSFVDNAPVAIAMLDRNLNYVATSRRWLVELDMEQKNLIGTNVYIAHPNLPEYIKEVHRKGLEGESQSGSEMAWTWPDGTKHWQRWGLSPWRDNEGRIGGLVIMTEDTTRQRVLEKELTQAQKMEAIGTLAGGIAHDFNNILGAILGFTELAQKKLSDQEKAGSYLDLVLQAGSRGAALVKQILTFSRQKAQEHVPLQLRQIVAEPLKLLRASIPTSIEIRQTLPLNLPMVMADPTQIHQIVMNLCTNACHAMGKKPGTMDVRLDEVDVNATDAAANPQMKPGHFVRLTVSDTGHGMDEATLKRIYEPFFTTKAPGEGTGLGLPVVHGIVHNHGGAITVYSEVGKGTTFEVYLPALELDIQAEESIPDKIPEGHGEHILFVDDEKPLALLGHHLLEEIGYTVTSCTSPQEALNLLMARPHEYVLIVTDLNMPVMNGFDLAAQALNIRPELPILLSTGNLGDMVKEEANAKGIACVVRKPFTTASLGLAIHRALTGKPCPWLA